MRFPLGRCVFALALLGACSPPVLSQRDSGPIDSATPGDASVDRTVVDAGAEASAEDSGAAGADAASEASADATSGDAANDASVTRGYNVVGAATGASCEAMTAPMETTITGDDFASRSPVELPFAVTYFGRAATHYSVSTNGFAQLWPSEMGTPSTDPDNVRLPSPLAPEGMLGAFWDDLSVELPASIRVEVRGVAPLRWFVIEWNDAHTIDAAGYLRFQVKLFETTNVIEFHYCSMMPRMAGTRHSGDSATIGLVDFTRANVAPFAFERADAAPTGAWIQFTPR